MAHLGDNSVVVQADRARLLDLLQTWIAIDGTPLQPPFRLRVPKPSSPIFGPQPDAFDAVIRDVQLSLEPGTKKGLLHLDIEAGVLRIDGGSAQPIQNGEVQIEIEFQDGKLFALKLLEATFSGVSPALTDTAGANAIVNHILDKDRETVFELFDPVPMPTGLFVIGSLVRALDTSTVVVHSGGSANAITRSITTSNEVSLAVAATFIRSTMLCRALLAPAERDPAWIAGGPTANELALLPPPCGTGELKRGNEDADVRITQLDFTFREGFIEISGRFNAEDTCWEVEGGTFSQRLFMDFDPLTGGVTPRLEPAEPTLNYTVDVDFLCELVGFVAGLILPVIGSVVLGIAAVIAIEIAKGLVEPSIPTQPMTPFPMAGLPGVRWNSLAVTSEGLVVQGSLTDASVFPAVNQPSRGWLRMTRSLINVTEGRGGSTVYHAPTCEPQTFEYRDYTQIDQRELQGEPEWLIEPVKYEWTLNGSPLTVGGGASYQFTTNVRTAVPPPDGVEVSGHTVRLDYDFGWPLIGNSGRRMTLTPRSEDLNYSVQLDLRMTDAAGRIYYDSASIRFEGVRATFGKDYDDYRDECFGRVVDIAESKKKVKQRLRPGEPQEQLEWAGRYILGEIRAGNPEVASVIASTVKMHGIEAVNQAIARISKGPQR